ncbi:5-dehydro-4-deoxy-D-glucuronate isomerase [Algivirga pacifica]|uniref:4-deoxy-L-threo-5-hexosulose-uronate ketol-isomerase n=1 Tax=Algivirga pacifica TaxID=1162670 RepID=A0ABP9D1A7_9BACT
MKYDTRYGNHPEDVKSYDTERLRKEFLIERIFEEDQIHLTYTHHDRYIAGGAMPVQDSLSLQAIDPLKSSYFLERREMGIINVGGDGVIEVNDQVIEMGHKEALYIGKGNEQVLFKSLDPKNPAKFYINSTPAHQKYPVQKVTKDNCPTVELGSREASNHRTIHKLLVNSTILTCQLQMGMTELKNGSVWNTMPGHVHDRRMEVYFYFDLPEEQAVCHFMGQPQESRHLWMHNEQAVISPAWSMHSGAGTSNYTFIWGMAGENLDYDDMDKFAIKDLR